MTWQYILKTALRGLRANRSRSLLTILGIVIGITAIMMVMSLGQGAQKLILSQIQSIGSKTIAVVPGKMGRGISDALAAFSDSLKNHDLEQLEKKNNAPHIHQIMPIVFMPTVVAKGNDKYQTTVYGATNYFSQIYNIYPDQGQLFTDDDVKSYAEVVVIGADLKDKLFGQNDAVGQKIRIKDRNFKIVGVLSKKGQFSFISFDSAMLAPYTTVQQIIGIKHFNRLVIEVDSESAVDQTVQDIKATIRSSHNITDPEKDDFTVETQAQAMQMVGTIMNVLTLFLAAVAAISLVVGGVGIMNIMLVSVTERTREIGLRKALGATEKNILTQFLLEAIILTAVGGLVGIILGASFSFLATLILKRFVSLSWSFTFPVSAAILGLAVSTGVGLLFGLYPARRASMKNPIEALRYE